VKKVNFLFVYTESLKTFNPIWYGLSVTEAFKENEAVKLIRLKQNLLKVSESYVELAHKCIHVFEAQADVARALPDAPNTDIHDIKYTGKLITSI